MRATATSEKMLEKMSVTKKLHMMELIWDDLCHQSSGIKSPLWHEDVLNEREKSPKKFDDWSKAKSLILKKTK